jgi:hypothetical protein
MTGSKFGNTLYAEFATGNQGPKNNIDFSKPDFYEYYELDSDPWEIDNKHGAAQQVTDAMAVELHKWFDCAGVTCP